MTRTWDEVCEILNEGSLAEATEAGTSKLTPSKQLSAKSVSLSGDPEDVGESCCRRFTSCRWVVGYLCCAARFSQSAIRQCIGMAVVCMTLSAGKSIARSTVSPADVPRLQAGVTGNVTFNETVASSDPEVVSFLLLLLDTFFFFFPFHV